jgi:hypothetical protein
MARGFLAGLLVTAVGIAALCIWKDGPRLPVFARALLALAVAFPLITLLILRP